MEKIRNKQIWVLFLIMFTDMIGFGMALPLFGLLFGSTSNPFYLGNLLDVVHITFYFGLFTALYGLGQFFANPILGSLSDTIGRKPVLAYAIFGTFISRLIFLVGLLQMNIFLLFFARFLDGATGGIVSLGNASVTDTTTPEERGKYIGKVMSGFSLGGFVMGPIIFTAFSYTGEYYSVIGPFALATLLSLMAFTACLIFFPETLSPEKIQKIPSVNFLFNKVIDSLKNILLIAKMKDTRPFFIASGVFYFAFTSFTTFSSQYLFSDYKFDSQQTGIYFLILGVAMTVMQGFVAYKLIQKYDFKKYIVFFSLGLAISILVTAFGKLFDFATMLVFINAIIFAVFVSLNMVFLQTEIAKIKTEHKGALLGSFSSIQVLAMGIAPIFVGYLASFKVEYSFVFSAALIFVSGILLKRALK